MTLLMAAGWTSFLTYLSFAPSCFWLFLKKWRFLYMPVFQSEKYPVYSKSFLTNFFFKRVQFRFDG